MPNLLSIGWRTMLLVLSLSPGFSVRAQQPAPATMGIDHLVLGINALETGVSTFKRLTGVAPVRGGEHPGLGTENALVSLGDGQYLEVIAPTGRTSRSSFGDLSSLSSLTPVGWAIHTGELRSLVYRLREAGFTITDPQPGSRKRPDGTLLSWQAARLSGNGLELAPFFIQWGRGVAHPSTTSPTGCRLRHVALRDPSPSRLAALFRILQVDVSNAAGATRSVEFSLHCPHGDVTFTSRS
jgi:hypothetical protein